ncbi:MAG: GTP-binding protein [Chloroflexi bacterium]|nr:MAG: GTP-binding protein [Chloroflexota bacterium]
MADKKYYSEEEDERRKKLQQDVVASALRQSERPTTIRELGTTALKNLPANISMVQSLMKAVNWRQAQQEVLEGLNNTVVIVGQPNTGKSTLFNKIKGQTLSPVSSQAGTTRTLVRTDFGPFTLVDTPGHLPNVMESGMEQASIIVFLIDASKGLQAEDRELYEIIKHLKKPTIVAVNKVDALRGGENGDQFATEVAVQLNVPGVIPISARTGENVAEELIPAIIAASPEAALVIGRELPAYRRVAAQRIIRNGTLLSLAAGLEPIPLVDIPILLGTQVRLVLRLAVLYGEPLDTADAMRNARELITTMISGLGLRYLAQQAAKAVPFGGDFVAGLIAAAATWSIGQVALEYYEGGKTFSPHRLQQHAQDLYRSFRRNTKSGELRGGSLEELEKVESAVLESKEKPSSDKEVPEEGTA